LKGINLKTDEEKNCLGMPFFFIMLLLCCRFVFGMGFSDTRVEKNGKTVLTLTDAVKRLINGLQSFEEKLLKAQGNS